MRCGAKCFTVQYEEGGQIKTCEIIARTPVEVRKIMKEKEGTSMKVKKVVKKNK